MKIRSTFLIIIICFSTGVSGQDIFFRQYTNEHGLHHPFVYSINQDENGFLWIGTGEGLYRFNGFDFEYFTTEDGLADNFITKIFRDKAGKLWIGHQNGSVSVLTGKEFITLNNDSEAYGSVSDIAEDDHGFILALIQNQGLVMINEDMVLHKLGFSIEQEPLSEIEYLGNQYFLIGSQDNIYLSRYESSSDSMLVLQRLEGYPGSKVVEIIPVYPDNYIVISQDDGFYRFEFDTLSSDYLFASVDDNADGVLDNLQGGLVDGNGTLWLNSMGNGLINYIGSQEKDYTRMSVVSTVSGLVSDNVRSIFEDFEGNLWFGMYGEGILRYVDNNLAFYRFGPEDGSNRTYSISGDESSLWVAMDDRVLRINPGSGKVLESYPISSSHEGDRINASYLDEDGKLWLGFERSGLYVSSSPGAGFRSVFLSNDELANSVNHITGNEEYLWVGTKKGICRISNETGTTRWFKTDDGLPHNNIQQLYIDSKGRVLIATLCSELHYINDMGEVGQLDNSRIGPFNTVTSIAESQDGTIWVGTQGNGVWKIEEGGNVNYTRASGLISDFCYSLTITGEGMPVIGHRGGISQIDPKSNRIKTFSRLEGVKSSAEFYPNAIFSDNLGRIWFGTSEGLVRYASLLSAGGRIPPKLNINTLSVDDERVDHSTGLILLKPGKYQLAVDYIGINFSNPEMVIYQTMLEGYNKNWSALTSDRRVVYDRIEHGNYIFKIRTFNENDIGSEISSAFELRIKKPVYFSIWFYGVIACILGFTFFLVIKLRERNLRTEQERLLKNLDDKTKEVIVKEEIIKERKRVEKQLIEARNRAEQSDKMKSAFLANISHEFRTPMNAIVGFSQLLNIKDLTDEKRAFYVDLIQDNSNSLLVLLENIIELSNLETGQTKLDMVDFHLNPFLEKIYSDTLKILDTSEKTSDIQLQYIPGVDDNEFTVRSDERRISEIFNRLLDNAIKYTETGHVHFGYRIEKKYIRYYVEDTGIGLDEEKKKTIFKLFGKSAQVEQDKVYSGTGLGLSISQRLVKLFNGEIGVESEPGKGSIFYFDIPLNNR